MIVTPINDSNGNKTSQLIDSLNKFSIETLQLTNSQEVTTNSIFSPFSAFVCVAMSAPLFKDETQSEILKSLEIKHLSLEELSDLINKEKTDKVSTSNRIWANDLLKFSPSTFEPNEKFLKIPVERTRFPQPGCDQINDEVNQATKGMIQKLVEPSDVSADTAIVLLNAIYFKSDWFKKFDIDPESNYPTANNFTLADGRQIHVTMLFSNKRDLPYFENDHFQVVSIPYLNNEYDFVVILPKSAASDGYRHLSELNYETVLNKFIPNLRKRKLNLRIPKFTLESKFELKDVFRTLGMKRAFDGLAQCTDPNVAYFVSSIIQKAKIIVDENGTQAAAATGMIMKLGCARMHDPIVEFVANHPFVFLLRNRVTGAILFEGFLKNPLD